MAKFEIVSVGTEGQYTVKEHLDVAGISERITQLGTQIASLNSRNAELQGIVDALSAEISSVMTSIEGYLTADPPDVTAAEKLIAYSNTLSDQAGRYNREISANGVTIAGNNKTIDSLNDLLDQQDIVHDAVCTDGDDTLEVGDVVGSVELDRIPAAKSGPQKVIIRPGVSAVYNPSRDGIVKPAMAMGGAELFLNQALMPSAQIYLPRYVQGTITALDTDLDTASVTVSAFDSNHPLTWWEGSTPVRIPDVFLTNIPVDYQDCNASAFEIGDDVVVQYISGQATVIGFLDNPKSCGGFLVVATPLNYVDMCGIECDAAFEVDWGDGVFIPYAASRQDVVPTGIITVRGIGAVTWFRFHTDTFSAIDVQASSTITSLNSSFYNLSNLTTFDIVNTTLVTDFYYAWRGCSGLTSFPLIDVSGSIYLPYTWFGCSSLTSFPLIDTSTIIGLGYTWVDCSSLTVFPAINTSNCGLFFYTWEGCSGLTSFPLIDVSSGNNFAYTWHNCVSLSSFPELIYASTGITNFRSLWRGCSGLIHFPAIDLTGASAGVYDLWSGCSSLESIGLVGTTGIVQIWGLFYGCISLICIGGIDTSDAATTSISSLFPTPSALVAPTPTEQGQISSTTGLNYVNPSPCP